MSFDVYSRDLDRQKYVPLPNKKLVELQKKFLVAADRDAWQQLWQHGLRIVLKIVNHMVERGILRNLPKEDAIQAGNLAVGEALLAWEPKKGAYSTWVWIKVRGAIIDADVQEGVCGFTGGPEGDFLTEPVREDGEYMITTQEDPETLLENMDPDDLRPLLSRREASYVYQVYWLGISPSDLAKADGISRQRVDQVLSIALNRLRLTLAD